MRKLILVFVFFPFFIYSQSNKDLKKYQFIADLIKKDDLEAATIETNKLIKRNKNWKKPHLLLSSIFWRQRKYEESELEYFKFHSLDPQNKSNNNYVFYFAEKCFSEGLYEKALKYFELSKKYGLQMEDTQILEKIYFYISNCSFAIESMNNPVDFKYQNMGNKINSEYAEYLPYISIDANKFIFTRLVQEDIETFQEDFYYSIFK